MARVRRCRDGEGIHGVYMKVPEGYVAFVELGLALQSTAFGSR